MGEASPSARVNLDAARTVVARCGLESPWRLDLVELVDERTGVAREGLRLELVATRDLPAVTLEAVDVVSLASRALSAERRRERAARVAKKAARRSAARQGRAEPPIDRRILRAFRSHTSGWNRRAKRRAWARVRWCVDAQDVVTTLEALRAELDDRRSRRVLERRASGDTFRAAGFVHSPAGGKLAIRSGRNLEPGARRLLERLGLGEAAARLPGSAQYPQGLEPIGPSDGAKQGEG